MGDYIVPASTPTPTPTNRELSVGLQAQDAREANAAAVRGEPLGHGPFIASCLCGGCDWWICSISIPELAVQAERHRNLMHDWVAPGRVHRIDPAT